MNFRNKVVANILVVQFFSLSRCSDIHVLVILEPGIQFESLFCNLSSKLVRSMGQRTIPGTDLPCENYKY